MHMHILRGGHMRTRTFGALSVTNTRACVYVYMYTNGGALHCSYLAASHGLVAVRTMRLARFI